ncbi:DUF3224 domain-containing protein [Streptomyces sp. NPDC001982]|uniref:DUF3224 domain-containing protein n=1 Tax=Streptomyces sp. NPDC001982 TaxID=3154405 RepID=UPI00332073F9
MTLTKLATESNVPGALPGCALGRYPVMQITGPRGWETGTVTPSEKIVCASGGTAIHGSATFKAKPGDRWHGTTSYDYCLYPESTPGSYSYSGTETLTGTVDGCGKGSFTYFGKGETASGGTWKIIRGSGTGRLTHASGSGTDTATTDPTTLENWGVFQGQFTC